jgi:predicted metal-dependent phosphotriesterase family hydrolase
MNVRTAIRIARELRPAIGAHTRLIGNSNATQEQYEAAELASSEAVSLAKYLICHLDDRHAAVVFARAVGMPGYINLR